MADNDLVSRKIALVGDDVSQDQTVDNRRRPCDDDVQAAFRASRIAKLDCAAASNAIDVGPPDNAAEFIRVADGVFEGRLIAVDSHRLIYDTEALLILQTSSLITTGDIDVILDLMFVLNKRRYFSSSG